MAPADAYPGDGYDLIAIFDALHDMGDPLAAAAHVRRVAGRRRDLPAGRAGRRRAVEGHLNPVGRIVYPASLFSCVPNARSHGGPGLGNQVPEATGRDLLAEAGFTRVRRATETPFSRVFGALP